MPLLPSMKHHCTMADTHFLSRVEGYAGRGEGWLITHQGGSSTQRWSPTPVANRFDIE